MTRIGLSIFEEGLEQGREEGRRETRRQMLLEARFRPVPDTLRRRVEATDDVALVDHWFRVAARAESIAEVEGAIG